MFARKRRSEEGDALLPSHLGVVVERGEDVVRKTRQKVDDEPALEVVHADDARLGDHLAGGADERHVEVEEDVDEEDDVDKTVDHQHGHVVHRLALGHVTHIHAHTLEHVTLRQLQ